MPLIPELRKRFNDEFTQQRYERLLMLMEERCGTRVEYRMAETPVFLPLELLEGMAREGAELTRDLIGNAEYLAAAEIDGKSHGQHSPSVSTPDGGKATCRSPDGGLRMTSV